MDIVYSRVVRRLYLRRNSSLISWPNKKDKERDKIEPKGEKENKKTKSAPCKTATTFGLELLPNTLTTRGSRLETKTVTMKEVRVEVEHQIVVSYREQN